MLNKDSGYSGFSRTWIRVFLVRLDMGSHYQQDIAKFLIWAVLDLDESRIWFKSMIEGIQLYQLLCSWGWCRPLTRYLEASSCKRFWSCSNLGLRGRRAGRNFSAAWGRIQTSSSHKIKLLKLGIYLWQTDWKVFSLYSCSTQVESLATIGFNHLVKTNIAMDRSTMLSIAKPSNVVWPIVISCQ